MVRIIAAKYIRTTAKSLPLFFAMVVFPLMMTFFMGMAMPAPQPEAVVLPRVPVLYYSADPGPVGQQFRDYLTGTGLTKYLRVHEADAANWQSAREENSFSVAVLVPADFSRRYGEGEAVVIRVVRGQGSWLEANIVTGIVRGFTDELNIRQAVAAAGAGGTLVETTGHVRLQTLPRAPALAPVQFFAAATLVMFLLLAGATGAIRLISEREDSTLLRVYAGPVTRTQILLGNLLGQLVVTLGQAVLVMIAGTQLLGVNWGTSWAGLAAITTATAFVATALAFLFAFLFNSAKVAGGAIPVFVIMMSFVSGGMTGMEGLSPTLRAFSDFTLNKWAFNAYTGLMQGWSIGDILPNLAVLTTAGGLLTGIAVILANRRETFYE